MAFSSKSLTAIGSIFATMALCCCTVPSDHYVVASTSTVIGVELSQNPANQAPQAKLGYDRSELAVVPTNRAPCIIKDGNQSVECETNQGNGAKDSVDVLMELRYGGIFDTGPSSGIYQRLAVGSEAVKQPGASVMFARDSQGGIDPNAQEALENLAPAGSP